MPRNLVKLDHPLIDAYLTRLRDRETNYVDFREYVDKLSFMLAYESGRELEFKNKRVNTPLTGFIGKVLIGEIVLVPILRAGLGLINGFNQVFPDARISHIGIYRDEGSLKPVKYYFKFPRLKSKQKTIVFILDPMLATGGSINSAIAEIKRIGIRRIVVVSIVSSPEGIKEVSSKNRDVKIYTCAVDNNLNDFGYIVPGLGDAGDRIFGT